MLKEISGHTKMMGTVGHPVAHSLSPMIHTALGLRYDRDLVYLAYDITADRVKDFTKAMRTLGILGCNITMPDKEAILPYLDELDPFAARCGAVNLVKNTNGVLKGYNVDAEGFLMGLEAKGLGYRDKKLLVLGAGGAAKSIVESALDHGAAHICVLNRSEKRARELCNGRPSTTYGTMTTERMCREAPGADLIINTTSLGMEESEADYTDFSFLDHTKAAVGEVVYRPLKTKLVQEAEKRGLTAVRGLDMLIYQALRTFEIVNDVQTDPKADYDFLEKLLLDAFAKR